MVEGFLSTGGNFRTFGSSFWAGEGSFGTIEGSFGAARGSFVGGSLDQSERFSTPATSYHKCFPNTEARAPGKCGASTHVCRCARIKKVCPYAMSYSWFNVSFYLFQ